MNHVAELDVFKVRNVNELHQAIASALNFPDYYEANWDAFDEYATDPEVVKPSQVRIRGLKKLRAVLPGEVKLMIRCFAYAEQEGMSVEWQDS